MKLNVLERFQTLNLLPEEGNIATMRMRLKLIEKIGLTAEEIEKYEVRPGETEGTMRWNEKGLEEIEIDLKGPEIAAIAKNLKKLNEDEKLTQLHLTLYDKFVGEEEN